MINRIIIRIKVLLVTYAYYQKGNKDLNAAENELMFGLHKTYDLYHYLLWLIPLLTDFEQKRVDSRKNRLLATDAEKNPNMKFANNRFAEQLRTNDTLQKFVNEKGSLWNEDDTVLLKYLLDKILGSDIYQSYLQAEDSYEADREFWRVVFKRILCEDPEIDNFLEDKSIYWNDDLDIVGTFVVKTIKRFEESNGSKQELMPMFSDAEDKRFAIHLLRRSILEEKDSNERINKQIKNWDIERLASVDLYIMQMAMSELLNFPTIPVNVTLNEYIEIAKCYSTPKSATFINGILDAIVNELKSEQLLFKN